MEENTRYSLKAGDWVKGKSRNGEWIRGYIENVDPLKGTVHVTVVECDNEKTMNKTIETPIHWVEKMPITSFNCEEQIRDLVDLALWTRDEMWFMELTAKLQSFPPRGIKTVPRYPSFRVKQGDRKW